VSHPEEGGLALLCKVTSPFPAGTVNDKMLLPSELPKEESFFHKKK
jgi:hypothetical protein